jgi:hypothetical protein
MFRCVAGEPTRSATSPLTRLAPSRCRRPPPGYVTELAEPSSAPSPPALTTRDGDRFCKRSSPAPPPRYVTEGAREGSTFRANRSGIARATVVGHADGGRPRDEDPALSWRLRETRAAAPPTPLAVWLSPPLRSCSTPSCSRNLRQAVKQNTFASRPAGSPPRPRAERRVAACSFRCPLPPGTAAPAKLPPT